MIGNHNPKDVLAMSYYRVLPRDLFNESKLLKCVGQLSLLIHEGVAPDCLRCVHAGQSFVIEQRQSDGGLYLLHGPSFRVRSSVLELYSIYNSQSPYPLLCDLGDDVVRVFDDDGNLTSEFVKYLSLLDGVS